MGNGCLPKRNVLSSGPRLFRSAEHAVTPQRACPSPNGGSNLRPAFRECGPRLPLAATVASRLPFCWQECQPRFPSLSRAARRAVLAREHAGTHCSTACLFRLKESKFDASTQTLQFCVSNLVRVKVRSKRQVVRWNAFIRACVYT